MPNPVVATIPGGAVSYRPVVRRAGHGAGTRAGFAWSNPSAFASTVADPSTSIPSSALGQNLAEAKDSGFNPATFLGANVLASDKSINILGVTPGGRALRLPDTFRCYSATAFTGAISGSILTASAVTGTLDRGQTLWINGVKSTRVILSQITGGAGGAGTYLLSTSGDVASAAMAAHHANELITFVFKHEAPSGSSSGLRAFAQADTTTTCCWGATVNTTNPNNYNFLAAGAGAGTVSNLVPGTQYIASQHIEVNGDGTRRSRVYLGGKTILDDSRAFTSWPVTTSYPMLGYQAGQGSLTVGWNAELYECRRDHMSLDPIRSGLDIVLEMMKQWYPSLS